MIENIKVKEIMTSDVLSVHDSEKLSAVARIFRRTRYTTSRC